MSIPSIVCLCPTYGRPLHLIQNTIQCFLEQDYPEDKRLLVIYDDFGNLKLENPSWFLQRGVSLISTETRCGSLPEKYNALVKYTEGMADHIVVWEDDEIYLPEHLKACAEALSVSPWAHPKWVYSTYGGKLQLEEATGRFHAALAFRRDFLRTIGGWPATQAPTFDQQLIRNATDAAAPGRPDQYRGATYVFRWQDTGATHGQNTMGSGDRWYSEYRPQVTQTQWITLADVQYDDAAKAVLNRLDIEA